MLTHSSLKKGNGIYKPPSSLSFILLFFSSSWVGGDREGGGETKHSLTAWERREENQNLWYFPVMGRERWGVL